MPKNITVLAILSCALACLSCALQITKGPPTDRDEAPIPSPFEGSEAPPLEPTAHPGLQKAPSLGPNVYFHPAEDLWYRWAYRRWYQAFRWDGNWFVLMETPSILADVELEKVELPTLKGLEELPPLPPVPPAPKRPEDPSAEPF